MTRPSISVLTPTFNRAGVLHRAYHSLKRQSTRDFEWVVVDDGSTDCTPSLLASWQAESDFPITWLSYRNNRGRNAAVNVGISLVASDFTLVLDSDDELLSHALETVASWRTKTGIALDSSVCQLLFRCVDNEGRLIGNEHSIGENTFEKDAMTISYRAARYETRLTVELISVTKTEVLLKHKYIELTDSEHCSPSISHNRRAREYNSILVDVPIRRYFRNDGTERLSSKHSGSVKMPRGNYLRAMEMLNNDIEFLRNWPAAFVNAARKMVRLGLHIGRTPHRQLLDLSNWRARLLWASCFPAGVAGYFRDRLRRVRAPRAHRDIAKWGPAPAPRDAVFHRPPHSLKTTQTP